MICLCFSIDDVNYAFRQEQIVELIPHMELCPVAGAPAYIPGCFNYRGRVTPVVDLAMLLRERASSHVLSTRIAVVRHGSSRLLGLLMENATETQDFEDEPQASGVLCEKSFMEGVLLDSERTVQLVGTEGLLPPEALALLYKD